jgi:hypothetical protein
MTTQRSGCFAFMIHAVDGPVVGQNQSCRERGAQKMESAPKMFHTFPSRKISYRSVCVVSLVTDLF